MEPDTNKAGLVRDDHPETSRQAALRIAPKSGSQRAKVLECLIRRGPSTDLEIQKWAELKPDTERLRRVELVTGKFVMDSGLRRDGYTVWMATRSGFDWALDIGLVVPTRQGALFDKGVIKINPLDVSPGGYL